MRSRRIILAALAPAAVFAYLWARSGSRPGTVAPVALPGDERHVLLVTDDFERAVPMRAPARRVASLHPAFTEMIEALGAKSNLVGVTAADSSRLALPALGSHVKPDLEAVLACRPDLILLPARNHGLVAEMETRAAAAGASLLAWRPVTVAQSLARLADLGRILDRKAAAASMIARAEEVLAETARAVSSIPFEERPKVFLEVRAVPALLTCGRESVAFDIIRLAGGRPIPALPGSVAAADVEAVVSADPDVYLQQRGAMNPEPADIRKHPVLGRLRAAREGRVFQLEESILSRPGARTVEAVVMLHALLYPATKIPDF